MDKILKFKLNGCEVQVIAGPENTLLEVLRDKLNLTSPKCGCNHGDCGACTVLLDGKAVKSCIVLAYTVEGHCVVTVDGICDGDKLHPVQQAFHDYGAPQCGFCTPGMVMASIALLDTNPTPTKDEIKDALSGNLCRCSGYQKYTEAVMAVAKGEFGPLPKGCEQNV